MAERTLDQVIAHYQAAGQQITMPTPTMLPMVTPRTAAQTPYIVPNAFQSTYAPGMSRVIEQIMGRGATSGAQTAPPVTPQPMIPMPMFHDPFQAMAQRNLSGLNTTAAGINRQWVSQAGQRWGGRVGGAVGAVGGAYIGGPSGALSGEFLGEMAGSWAGGVANDIPLVGSAMRGYNRLMYGGAGGAMSQMAGANRLRQGTFGRLQMMGGGGDITGTGLGAGGALQMSQGFGQANIPGMNRNDLINLAGAAAQTGFLDDASNVSQVIQITKKLARFMGELSRLTGDPSFIHNLEQMRQMSNMGMTVTQSMDLMRNMPMYGRMAGGMPQAARAGGFGASVFQQLGLTPALGMQTGATTAGMVHRGMGGITPTQRGLWGGEQEITKDLTAMQGKFLAQTSRMLLPYLTEQGPNGELQINQERMQAFRSGEVSFQDMVGQGTANLGRMGFKSTEDLLIQAPELQSQLGTQLGPYGGFAAMSGMVRNLQQNMPSLTLGGAASTVMGDVKSGRELEMFMTNPAMIQRLIKDVTVQQRRVHARGRQAAIAAEEAQPGPLGRAWNAINAPAFPGVEAELAGQQGMEAFERTREQADLEAERTGLRSVMYRPGSRVTQREQELAGQRLSPEMQQRIRLAETPETGMEAGELSGAQEEALISVFGTTRPSAVRGDPGQWLASDAAQRRQALIDIQTTGKRTRETRKYTEKQFSVGEQQLRKTMEEQFEDKFHAILAAIKTRTTAYARDRGSQTGRALDMKKVRGIIRKALIDEGGFNGATADKWMAKNGDAMERWAIRWIDQSGDKNALRALQNTERAAGLADNAFSIKATEENQERLGKLLNATYEEIGLAASAAAPTPAEEAGIAAFYEEEDPAVRAAATLLGQTEFGSEEEHEALAEQLSRAQADMGEKKWARVEALSKKLQVSGQTARMRTKWGGKVARGETTLKEYGAMYEQGIRGEGGEAGGLKYRTRRAFIKEQQGVEPTEVGKGVGRTTVKTEKEISLLEEQKDILENMATNMNEAAASLERTSANFAEAKLRESRPDPTTEAGWRERIGW